MSLDAAQRKALKALYAKRSPRDLKRLFALIRAHDDRTLLAARTATKRKRAGDPLVKDLTATLRPLIAPAPEKAELLLAHMAKKHRRKLGGEAKGLAHAARRLRAHFSEAEIRAGADAMMANLTKLYAARETVV